MNTATKDTCTPPDNRATNAARESWLQPRADLIENKNGFRATLDMPGVNKDSLNVFVHERTLTIEGRRETAPSGATLHRESNAAGFRRRFTLGESIEVAAITVSIRNGVATIGLPKVAQAKPRNIPVAG